MTFATPWLGRKRVAFVPLFRSRTLPPDPPDQIPPDWENVIRRRVVYDPRPAANGADRSLRAWLRAASSGLADIDPLVLSMQTIDKPAVAADELEGTLGGRLRDQGMDAAVLVMLGGRPSGTNDGFWSRVVMVESNGVWLMELIHGLTGFKDLYHFDNDADPRERDIDIFDEMSASSQTHPTAFTKNELGWLPAAAIPLHVGASIDYELQHISLAQPPAAGRAAAVRIGDGFPYIMVEARKMTDQFEGGMPSTGDVQERGIASEGVIAYRIQTRNPTEQVREGNKKPLYLMTLKALQPGQSAALDNGVTLTVTGARADGFAIRIDDAGQHLGRSLQVVGITNDGGSWHTIRYPTRWEGFGDVKIPAGSHPGSFKTVGCAEVDAELHVCGVTTDGGMWHAVRREDGSWIGFGDVKGQAGNPGRFKAVGCAGVNGELQVCGVTDDGGMWHTIRYPIRWEGFGDVKIPAGSHPGSFKAVGCAEVDAELHVCGVTTDGGMWHAVRREDGSWIGFGDVKGQAGNPGRFKAVGCAGVNGELQVCGVTDDGGMWHTVRYPTRWEGFGDVKIPAGSHPGSFDAVGCAEVNAELHVCGVTTDGGMWHAVRREDGSWIGFGDVKAQSGNPGHFLAAAAAGVL